jgi:SAM-dependent methyltransferase
MAATASVRAVRERRLTFGKVADLYDRARPSYPRELVEDLVELAGADRAVEVGAGTGKATVLFAERGVSVLAIEPGAEMAAVARRNCARYPAVSIEQVEFEQWHPEGERFPLLYSAQAWHWVAPELRYPRARAALRDGGLLAAFWNRIDWDGCELVLALRDAYDRSGADPAEEDPMDPRGSARVGQRQWWTHEIDCASGFGDPEVRAYGWTQEYSTDEYVALLRTHSSQLVQNEAERAALLGFIAEAITAAGGRIRIPYVTQLCLARATTRP